MFKGKGVEKKLNVTRLIFSFLLVLTIVVFQTFPVNAAKQKPLVLRWANFQPRDADSIPPLIRWAKTIEKRSNGAIKIKMYFVGEIAETKDLIDLCRTGSIDMISTPPVYYTSLFPMNAALQTYYPLNKTVQEALYSWRGLVRDIPELQGEFEKQNIYCLNRSSLGVYKLISKKPVRDLADLKGMKIRIIGGDYPARMIKAAGAVPVFQAMQDVYEGFMRGVTDGVLLGVPAIATYRLQEIGKYIGFPIGSVLGWANCINLDVWKKMTPETRKMFQETAVQWGADDLQTLMNNEKLYTKKLKSKGVHFLDFNKNDYQKIVQRAGNPYEYCRKSLIQSRVAPEVADRFVKRWKELNHEYETKYLDAGKEWKYQ